MKLRQSTDICLNAEGLSWGRGGTEGMEISYDTLERMPDKTR